LLLSAIEEIAGALLGILVLVDIFLVVLYTRTDMGVISRYLSHALWRILIWVSWQLGRKRKSFLVLTGPIILLAVLGAWALLMSLAAALIVHPNLGAAIRSSSGNTPTDFITAFYVGATSLSFVGASDFTPETGVFRLFYVVTSLIGLSMLSLTITYLMQLYQDLLSRNSHALKVHLRSGETGDAAEVIARLGPQGQFDAGYQVIAAWADESAEVKESHAFYDMLFYFRFREPYYSISRTALTSLDTVALIRSALDDKEYKWLKESAAVDQLGYGALMELQMVFKLSPMETDANESPDEDTRNLWRKRYEAAADRLEQAGIKTKKSGADEYISLRSKWDPIIKQLAPQFGYDMDEIDPALAKVK
jgi:hypothetical protein